MKIYRGFRDASSNPIVTVDLGDEQYDLPHIVRYEPDCFEWGYDGYGPADLAFSLLADLFDPKIAELLHMSFKDVLAELPVDGFILSSGFVSAWAVAEFAGMVKGDEASPVCAKCGALNRTALEQIDGLPGIWREVCVTACRRSA